MIFGVVAATFIVKVWTISPLGKSVNNRLSYLLMPMYFAMNLAASIYLVVRNFPMRQIWGLTL